MHVCAGVTGEGRCPFARGDSRGHGPESFSSLGNPSLWTQLCLCKGPLSISHPTLCLDRARVWAPGCLTQAQAPLSGRPWKLVPSTVGCRLRGTHVRPYPSAELCPCTTTLYSRAWDPKQDVPLHPQQPAHPSTLCLSISALGMLTPSPRSLSPLQSSFSQGTPSQAPPAHVGEGSACVSNTQHQLGPLSISAPHGSPQPCDWNGMTCPLSHVPCIPYCGKSPILPLSEVLWRVSKPIVR